MAEHVPGPWKAMNKGDCWAVVPIGEVMGKRLSKGASGWSEIASCKNWNDFQEANARLIAAAPDMLEALVAMKAARDTAIVDDEFPALLHRADGLMLAALAKAKVEKP